MLHHKIFSTLLLSMTICLVQFSSLEADLGNPPGKNIVYFYKDPLCSSSCGLSYCNFPWGSNWDFNIEVDCSLTYSSKCVWRGLELVEFSCLQPQFVVSQSGFSVGAWINVATTSPHLTQPVIAPCGTATSSTGCTSTTTDSSGDSTSTTVSCSQLVSECDLTFQYANTFRYKCFSLDYSLGLCCYLYPTLLSPDTWELFLAIGWDTPLHPTLVFYYDIDKVHGWYISYEIEHTWERLYCICQKIDVGLKAGASIGWGSHQYNTFYYCFHDKSFLDLLFTASIPFTWDYWGIEPFFAGSYLINGEIRHHVRPGRGINYWGGVTVFGSF